MTDRKLLETIHGTPWIAELLARFDFDVTRAAGDLIEPVAVPSGEALELIAGDSAGGSFLLVGSGDVRPVLYVGSEGEGGLVAPGLRDALTLIVGVSSLHDATAFSVDANGGRDLRAFLASADAQIRADQPDLDVHRDRLRDALGLPLVDDARLRSLQAAAADFGYRPLNEQGCRLRPMLAWLEDSEEAAEPRSSDPAETPMPSIRPDEPMPGQVALF